MSLNYEIKPIEDRTGFHGRPKRSPFDSTWGATLSLLEREVRALSGKNVIIEVDVLPGAIRLDGQLYANAKVASPAVRLHMDTKHGHLSYETDAFTHWQDNVRAIALALEALRRVDRYQIGRGGEQYRGYLALEAGSGAKALGAEPAYTEQAAERAFAKWTGEDVWLTTDNPTIWKRARAAAHPDRNGGDRTGWDEVERAAKFFGLTS